MNLGFLTNEDESLIFDDGSDDGKVMLGWSLL